MSGLWSCVFPWCGGRTGTKETRLKLQFLGATRQVTGSRYSLRTPDTHLLIDCGMFQERPFLGRKRNLFAIVQEMVLELDGPVLAPNIAVVRFGDLASVQAISVFAPRGSHAGSHVHEFDSRLITDLRLFVGDASPGAGDALDIDALIFTADLKGTRGTCSLLESGALGIAHANGRGILGRTTELSGLAHRLGLDDLRVGSSIWMR